MKAIGFFYGAWRYGRHRETLFDLRHTPAVFRDILSPHPEEQQSGCVSKDAAERTGASFETRALLARQDEGS